MSEADIVGIIVLVAGSFAATNIDNLILMLVLMSAESERRAQVTLGFISSSVCILGLAAIGAAIGAGVDPELLGYLGLAPLTMGVYLLYGRLRGNKHQDSAVKEAASAVQSGVSWFSSFLLMFSNSGDSLVIFFPLLGESHRDSVLWEVAVFLAMTLLWTILAWRLSSQPRIATYIERVGEKLLPWIMMAVGIYILLDTATDTVT